MAPHASISPRTRRRHTKHNAAQGFIRLPGELRNYIWSLTIPSGASYTTHNLLSTEEFHTKRREKADQYALERQAARNYRQGDNKHYKIDYQKSLDANTGRRAPVAPPITQVCTALRAGTLDFFYGSNTFELRTNGDMSFSIMERWLGNCPEVGVKAMHKVTAIYAIDNKDGNEMCSHRLSVDLAAGVAEQAVIPDPRFGSSVFVDEIVHGPLMIKSDWPKDVDTTNFFRGSPCLEMPKPALVKKVEEAKRLYGFGDGQKMTRERLMKIVKGLNFHRKNGSK